MSAIKEMLGSLRLFVDNEHKANIDKLQEVWEKPLQHKMETGETQRISRVKLLDRHTLQVTLGDNESRFREGDMVCLHLGNPVETCCFRQGNVEAEYDGEWLIRFHDAISEEALAEVSPGCYADPDSMDMKPFYDMALNEIAESSIGREAVLPLLVGTLNAASVNEDAYDTAADRAEESGLKGAQIDAVGMGVAANHLACIQGPPGTGKTRVISLIAQLLVEKGENVFLTSHTHMAINNALNKIAETGVPVAKVGSSSGLKGLDDKVMRYKNLQDWENRPDSGSVIGATPFATCSQRIQNYEFDTVIFDEASQITLPLAVMAMRKARRFVFVGDHKQLPPVVLSASVLKDCSVFSRLIANSGDVSVMLNMTYRMCSALSEWPSRQYYEGELQSAGDNAKRRFALAEHPKRYCQALSGENPFVYIPSPSVDTRSVSPAEASLVVGIIEAAIEAGLSCDEVGVVTPFRKHARALKSRLAASKTIFSSKKIVTDTVERMQGQERELIIVSLCASDIRYVSAIADFFFQAERLNVAITRAKTKLILIGPELPSDFMTNEPNETLMKNVEAYRSLIGAGYRYRPEGT